MSAIIQVSVMIITLFIDIFLGTFGVDFSWMIALTIKTKTTIKARTPRAGLRLQSSFINHIYGTLAVLSV